jgi:hypothetical protein
MDGMHACIDLTKGWPRDKYWVEWKKSTFFFHNDGYPPYPSNRHSGTRSKKVTPVQQPRHTYSERKTGVATLKLAVPARSTS